MEDQTMAEDKALLEMVDEPHQLEERIEEDEIWSHELILKLIDMYRQNKTFLDEANDNKKHAIWVRIAKIISEEREGITSLHCIRKIREFEKLYCKTFKTKKGRNPKPVVFNYFEQFAEIYNYQLPKKKDRSSSFVFDTLSVAAAVEDGPGEMMMPSTNLVNPNKEYTDLIREERQIEEAIDNLKHNKNPKKRRLSSDSDDFLESAKPERTSDGADQLRILMSERGVGRSSSESGGIPAWFQEYKKMRSSWQQEQREMHRQRLILMREQIRLLRKLLKDEEKLTDSQNVCKETSSDMI